MSDRKEYLLVGNYTPPDENGKGGGNPEGVLRAGDDLQDRQGFL